MQRIRARLASSDGNDNKRYSLIFAPHARRSEHVPRPSPSSPQIDRRVSDSGPRPNVEEGTAVDSEKMERPNIYDHDNSNHGNGTTGFSMASSSENSAAMKRNRFSMLRFRHASDPQLSVTYSQSEKDVPPVPQVPPPPTIITTAPTNTNLEKSARKSRLRNPLSRKASKEAINVNASGSGLAKLPHSQTLGGHSRLSHEEPGRLSTSTYQSGTNPSEQDMRFSESSRSDQGSIERGPVKGDAPHPTKRLHMPRLLKSHGNIFPLPVKLQPPDASKASSGRVSPISNGGNSARTSMDPTTPDGDQISPLPSPTQSSVKLASPKASNQNPLLRKNSTISARSGHSASSAKVRLGRRGRSSTLNSFIEASRNGDDPDNSSSNLPSGRNSISTNGRKSFGDLFGLSHRLRQNSELSSHRDSHNSSRAPGTPTSVTRNNSALASQTVVAYPDRDEDDTPATYLTKLQETVPRGSVGTALCKYDDEFYKIALRKFMRTFAFFGEPIDMAIRKLLMEAELPKETQQIDRFLQGFADRYYECNPGVFATTDQTYFIAFSILILHTDVFNKNNKRKMQKQDYVKNSRIEGVSEEILECFYENISYTPFIHVEDELNLNSRQHPKRKGLLKAASSDHLTRASSQPVDPYAVILDGKLDTLRPSLKEVMNIDDPYSFPDSEGFRDIESLHQAFSRSAVLQIVSARSRPDAFMTSTNMEDTADSHPGLVDIKVVKVGLLWRKDPRKKRARSPWQEWGALLTSSQLYFFRDLYWTKSLMSQYENQRKKGSRLPVVFTPPVTDFKPDTIMSTSDAVGLIDSSYKKHKHAFLLVRHNGLEEVFLANSDADMNDWLAKLNYAATFRTTGVPLKATVGARYEGQKHQSMTRIDSTHSESSQVQGEGTTPETKEYVDARLAEEMSAARQQLMSRRIAEGDEKLIGYQKQLDDLLRNARHLQLLTPVNTRARENVILAAGRMAAKLRWVRLDMWRTRCYNHFLSLDLGIKPVPDAQKRSSLSTIKPVSPTANNSSLAGLNSTHSLLTAPSINEAVSSEPTSPMLPETSVGSTDFLSPIVTDGYRFNTSSFTSSQAHDGKQPPLSPMTENPPPANGDRPSGTLNREPSVLSTGNRSEGPGSSILSSTAHMSTTNIDNCEERVLREAGLLGVDGPTESPKPSPKLGNDTEIPEKHIDEKSESITDHRLNGHRRSLQRTLRDSHHKPSHQRSKKGRDSASSIGLVDNPAGSEGEGLSRKDANFTLHGKKASVITFGSEWANISAEERLKLRKPAASEEARASDSNLIRDTRGSISSASIHSARPQSMRSASTATVRSSRFVDSISVNNGIPEVPSLDIVLKENQEEESAAPSAGPKNASTTSATTNDLSNENFPTLENGELIDPISGQENPRLNSHEQAVGA
ncbi:guanyl-nucleotide exchange factor, putative [Talaromyces stipitatus ATCC 10500]|uniref:Guanyl-nucleotide exchange factor, putative n=1 Tax=Talaromyces stipitatus (strain ATCC 10500 / CBS 375.48 / QM 6759 / NRRL 1006) TaxID=441959 RepID=B8M2J9_TALSN|nr:guanyl-nucleotide exchange factor, putative [Talaromyces stipitatus ATCC 10500]EED21910.1 guanyl-nucleotide exchange factor, putative [Talaromyces stipitatus ATCC 10500]